MKLYVIRHGQTDWNVEGKIQGDTDIELNQTGIEQAYNAIEKIKKYDIDLIVSSPLKRARKTAEIINKEINCNIIFDDALKERCYGEYEGLIRKDLKDDELIQSGRLDNFYANELYKGIEGVQNLCNRVWKLIEELKNKFNDRNILLVTHGGTIPAIDAYFKGINEDGTFLKGSDTKNCEIITYI